jgi:acyl-CoA thioester hydrolase
MNPYTRKIHFYETDQMGIVHHSNFIRWLEEARVDCMAQMGYDYARLSALGVDIAVMAVNCEYKSMVRFGETVNIGVKITKLEPMRMTLNYIIRDADTSEQRAEAETRHFFYGRERGRPVSLKRDAPELYGVFEGYI